MFGNWLALAPRTSEEQPNRGAGLRVPSLSLALGTPQGHEQAKPGAFEAQASEMVEDRLPRWKVTRQVAPRTAGAQNVEDCIENGTAGSGLAACRVWAREGDGVADTPTPNQKDCLDNSYSSFQSIT
jgi:hypothetical protein